MPKWFFSSKENQDKLIAEIKEWRGTPFRHRAGVKKAGADCIHFALSIFDTLGATKDATKFIPWYGHDWCHHTEEQKLYIGLTKKKEFVEVGFHKPMNGDLILYQFGRAASHCGIYFNNEIHQSINQIGVSRMYWEDPSWARRRRFGFRIKHV
jgi:cell wall-associated NlpC family hydrolase